MTCFNVQFGHVSPIPLCSVVEATSFFHNEHKFFRNIIVYRNGGNNTGTSCTEHVPMAINTVTEDFAYFKARAGIKLGYIPIDCTEWSRSRPRRPAAEVCPPVDAQIEPPARCGLTTYTDRIRVYTRDGVMLENLYFVQESDVLFVVPPGDHFFWPGEWVGRKIVVPGVTLPDGSPITLETLSLQPRLFFIEKFVTDSEAERIVAAAKPLLHESRGFEQGQGVKIEARNSNQAWLNCKGDDGRQFVCDIDARIAAVTRIPLEHVQTHSDPLQVVHYDKQQHYHSHHDVFDPTLHTATPGLREGYNRMITLLWYLNDVPQGGETVFPLTGPNKFATEAEVVMASCERGLKVRPRKGAALLWYNLLPLGNAHEARPDRMSLHGGCDVFEGEKWASNKWIYNRRWAERDVIDSEMHGMSRVVDVPATPRYPPIDAAVSRGKAGADGSMGVSFKNALDETVVLYWVGQNGLVEMGTLSPDRERHFNSFVGHRWAAKRQSNLDVVVSDVRFGCLCLFCFFVDQAFVQIGEFDVQDGVPLILVSGANDQLKSEL